MLNLSYTPLSQILATTLILFAGQVSLAAAQSLSYDHNGSGMQVTRAGQQLQITYQTPRNGLVNQGVGPGTLLFSGTLDEKNYLSGMARIFRRGCGVIDYYVYGDFVAGRDFQLSGAAPVLAAQGCQVIDNTYDGANANLRFTIGARLPTPNPLTRPNPQAATRFCVGGITLGGQLNMRTGPGTQWGVIDQIPASSCRVLAAAPQALGWQPVEHAGTYGWVATQYLRPVE